MNCRKMRKHGICIRFEKAYYESSNTNSKVNSSTKILRQELGTVSFVQIA